MGFKSVFRSLQDVFPQVDVRILKAAAIEHSKDADAAVEFILLEVLPYVSIPGEAPRSVDKKDVEQSLISKTLAVSQTSAYNHDSELSSVGREEQGCLLRHKDAVEETNEGSLRPRSVASAIYDSGNGTHTISSTQLDDALISSPIFDCYGGNVSDQQLIPLEKHQEVDGNITVGSHLGSNAASSSNIHNDLLVGGNYSDNQHALELDLMNTVDCEPVASSFDADLSARGNTSSKIVFDSALVPEDEVATSSIADYKKLESGCSLENVNDHFAFDSNLADSEEKFCSTAIVTHSGQISSIDLLEDLINDAKNNKKTLYSSMETIINMMREVELKEKVAEQAKQDAARGSVEILGKAEELRQMIQQAQEANDMHAGEVYGERAILATEARELQSRLLNLSDERNKSLAILDEMCQMLEARLAAAEDIKISAELEKLEKEESAQKYLAEQEDLMDKVTQESRRLQLQADENSKLREFLMDRGHAVDILQGEIAVVCKDIKLLKEKCDSGIPLSKSLSSSQTSFILAQSGLSSKFQFEQEPSEIAGLSSKIQSKNNDEPSQINGSSLIIQAGQCEPTESAALSFKTQSEQGEPSEIANKTPAPSIDDDQHSQKSSNEGWELCEDDEVVLLDI